MSGIIIADPRWRRMLILMRILCPLATVLSALIAGADWLAGNYLAMAVASFCLGANLVFTWVQWKIFQL